MALLGQLTVGILGDMSGYSASLSSAQKETLKFTKGIENVGKNISTIGQSISGFGDKLTKRITAPAVGAAAALGGIALAKGFSRLVGIDTARAKLVGLGHDAKSVENIMESALDSVRGTAYGLDSAATTAASAVAAGIKPGKELTRYLTLTGDAAAIAGAGMDEMGSILNKVTTSNKAYNGELQQLSDRGLPIYQWLAAEAGVAAEAVFGMAKDGEISSEMLMNAIEKNIGGAAKTIGESSFTAAIANMWASVGRIGANFLDAGGKAGGFFSTIKPMISTFTDRLGGIEEKAKDLGVKFGEVFNKAIEKILEIKAKFDELSPPIQDLIKKSALIGAGFLIGIGPVISIVGRFISGIGGMITTVGTVMSAITKLGGVIGILTGPIGITIAAIAALIATGVLLYKNWDTVKEKAQAAFTALPTIIEAVKGAFMDFFAVVKEWAQVASVAFAPLLETVKGAFMNLFNSIKPIWESLKTLFDSLLPILKMVGIVLGGSLALTLGIVISGFAGLVSAIGPVINAFINLVDIVVNMVNVIIALLTGDFAGAMEYFYKIGDSVADFFKNLWQSIVNFTSTFVMTIINFFHGLYMTLVGNSIVPDMVNAIIKWFVNLLSKGKEVFVKIKDAIITPIVDAKNKAVQNITTLYNNSRDKFNNFRQTASTVFNSARDAIMNPINTARDRVVSATSNLYTSAKGKFNDLKSSATSIFKNVRDAIVDPINTARDKIKSAIDRIKGFFNSLKLKFPKIEMPKLPKFSLDGKFSLNPPSVPKLRVNWNALGGIFTKPTILNTATAGLQGVGEAGPEAILPLNNKVLGKIGQMISHTMPGQDNNEMVNLLIEQNRILSSLLNKNQDVYIDGEKLTDVVNSNNAIASATNYF